MDKLQRVYFVLLTTALMFSTLSCTRNMGDSTVTVSLDAKLGSFSNFKLQTAFINIHVPGSATIVKKYNYENQNIAKGSDIEISVDNVPQVTGTLVQFLGVFEDDTGVMDFSYGDAYLANSVANITASSAGTATAQGQISGRLLASTPKSGRMTAYYTPTANPAYPMAVETSDIVDGWFNIFALDGGATNALTYKLDDGTVVFNNLYLSSGALYINGSSVSSSTYVMKVSYPTTYRQDYTNGVPSGVKARPKTTLFYGYFNGGLAPSTPNKVCYPNFDEGVIGIYATSALANYVNYKYTGGSASDITVAGGTGVANDNFITGNGTCTPATSDHLFFIPQMAQQDIEKATMVLPPFTAVQPQVMGSEWLTVLTTANGGNTDYSFKWAYLPSLTASQITGVDILRYPSSLGSSGDTTCDSLIAQGAVIAGSETGTVSTKTVTVSSGSWNFAVCAYQTTAGVKKYYKNFLRSGCYGMCNPFHYGWAAGSGTVTLSSSQSFSSGVMSASKQRVSYVLSSYGSYPYYTELSVSSNAGFTAGQEVMLAITGAGSSVQCGSYDAGYAGFARVVGLDTGKIRINKGSFVDNVSTANLAGDPSTGTFCTLQAVAVPHFTNLTIDASGQLSADSYSHSTGGGVVAFRVNGLFTHNGYISASATGYQGGVYSGSYSGAGARNDIVAGSYPNMMGGFGNASGGSGGAGAEYGASGATVGSSVGGVNNINTTYINMLFGGGGGAGSSTNGTRGGGGVFITARKLTTASGMITAFGDATGAGQAGAGGGGSIILAVKEATGSGLILQATGGNATGSTGGVGGGGSVRAYFCNNNGVAEGGELLLTGSNIFTSIGTGSYTSGAVGGTSLSNAFPSNASGSNYYFCNQ